MIENKLIFDFYQTYSLAKDFRTGTLFYRSPNENLRFMATSGLLHFQGVSSCSKKRYGGIPPCGLVGIPKYTVSTRPISMPHVKGIEGNFYQILPFELSVVQYGKKTMRGDLGVHGDFNVKGTSGCIGIPPGSHWQAFEKLMLKLSVTGQKTIDLFVPMA